MESNCMKSVIVAGILASIALAGCSSSVDNPPDVNPPNLTSGNNNPGGGTPPPAAAPTAALFQPAQGVLPYPTDIWFSGSTDGTLNIPANALIPSGTALNALDGFSTNAVIRARFGSPITPASLTSSTVRVVQITTANTNKAPGPPFLPLIHDIHYTVGVAPDTGVGPTILEIRPRRPLESSSNLANPNAPGVGYLVILTNGITTAAGAATPDADYAAFKSVIAAGGPTCPGLTGTTQSLCQLTAGHLQIAQGVFGINPANVVLTFHFTTQATRDTMARLWTASTAQPIGAPFTGLTTTAINPMLPGIANVHAGTLQIPYYLNRAQPTTGSWQANPFAADTTSRHVTRFNPIPVKTADLMIPLLVTVPNAMAPGGGIKPAGGWPVLIFQHGITRDRTDMFALADTFAQFGFVVAAIDQPLHGITDPMNPLYARNPAPATGSIERTFDLDLLNNTSGAAGADTLIDSSGAHFIQLTSLLTSRDNSRQAAADLMSLTRSLPNLNLDADPAGDIDPARIHFLGHSLGGIVGGVYLGATPAPNIVTATLAMPGGRIANLLRESPTFGPRIIQGLAAQGLTQGSTLFEQFFRDAQTVIDAADPANYITAAAAARPIHIIQVVGNGTPATQDQVVPNTATQYLIDAAAGAITQITRPAAPGPIVNPSGHRVFVNFVEGDHSSILLPTASAAATQEMQTEAVSFAAGTLTPVVIPPGQLINVAVPAVIQP
jgi:hypothetical protein